MKSLMFATLTAATAVSPAFAQALSSSSNPADRPINVKLQDIKWEKISPELGEASSEIVIVHVDPQTQATQLMIRVPKNSHVARHWHSADETHTIISGAFILQPDNGDREELGPGSFNYIPRKMVHQAWTKPDEGALLFITVDGAWDINWVETPATSKK